jgi:hypothetical protein
MSKKPDLSKRINNLIRNKEYPLNIEDFLSEGSSQQVARSDESDVIISGPIEEKQTYKREEFRFTKEFSEKLRLVSFSLKKKKTEVVQEALSDYFTKHYKP